MARVGPFYSVELVQRSGGEARLDLTRWVQRFEYVDRERAADRLTLTVDNYDLSNFDDPVWKKGNLLDVSWGYPGNAAPSRRVVVHSVNGAQTLTVVCMGQELLMASARRARTFEDMTRSEVVAQLAREAGWSGDQLDVQETTVRYGSIAQARRTDAELIRRLAILEGFEWYVDFDGFHWHERRLGQRPAKVYVWHSDPGRGEVLGFDVENDVTARPGRVRVRGRDPMTGEDFEVEAGNEESGTGGQADRDVLSPIAEIVDPVAFEGIRLLDESAEPEARVAQEDVRATTSADSASAQREATARFRRAQQAAVKLNLRLIGDPNLLAKSVVELRNFGRRLSTRYYVREATHSIDPTGMGYECSAKLISDGHGGHSTESTRARGLSAVSVGQAATGRQNDEEPVAGAEPQAEGGRSPEEGAELEEFSRIDAATGEEILGWEDTRGRSRRESPEG